MPSMKRSLDVKSRAIFSESAARTCGLTLHKTWINSENCVQTNFKNNFFSKRDLHELLDILFQAKASHTLLSEVG